jgi:hypothetical protein
MRKKHVTSDIMTIKIDIASIFSKARPAPEEAEAQSGSRSLVEVKSLLS